MQVSSDPQLILLSPLEESYTRQIVGPRGGTTATTDPQFILGTVSLQTLTANLRPSPI
ncbi:MAG: hypothetical protein ACOX1Z_04155 [Candidatus Ratteibacteria bacterium]